MKIETSRTLMRRVLRPDTRGPVPTMVCTPGAPNSTVWIRPARMSHAGAVQTQTEARREWLRDDAVDAEVADWTQRLGAVLGVTIESIEMQARRGPERRVAPPSLAVRLRDPVVRALGDLQWPGGIHIDGEIARCAGEAATLHRLKVFFLPSGGQDWLPVACAQDVAAAWAAKAGPVLTDAFKLSFRIDYDAPSAHERMRLAAAAAS